MRSIARIVGLFLAASVSRSPLLADACGSGTHVKAAASAVS